MIKKYGFIITIVVAISILLGIFVFFFNKEEDIFEGTVVGITSDKNSKIEFIYEVEIMKFIFDENTKNEIGDIKCFDEVVIEYDDKSFESATYNGKAICSYVIESIK